MVQVAVYLRKRRSIFGFGDEWHCRANEARLLVQLLPKSYGDAVLGRS